MSKKVISLALMFVLSASVVAEAETNGYIEFSGVLREHSYDLDIVDGPNRYFVDELYRGGWRLEAGWTLAPSWTLIGTYTNHDRDNADGVILTPFVRVQAPIFYEFRRASIGLKKNWAIGDDLWLDTTLRYQRTAQGVGDFFIESGDLSFGLDTVETDNGTAAEVALRKVRGNWTIELIAGYDPHAGFELSASDIIVESSGYGGAGVEYRFDNHFKLGVEAQVGKVTDLALTLGVSF